MLRSPVGSNGDPGVDPRPAVSIAILQQHQQFLMQLRDDIPGILYPGYWAFFGGHLDPGEEPMTAMQRELIEEICYLPTNLTLFRSYTEDPQIIRHVYHAPLTVALDQLQLNEGWDMGLFTIEEIRQGSRYSERAGQVRPLGAPHQQILLDFLESNRFVSSMG